MEMNTTEHGSFVTYPIQFIEQEQGIHLPVPLVRVTCCGMMMLEVLKEVVSSDPPRGRYEVVSTQDLRGRGAVPSMMLLKLLASQPHRFATKDWLATQMQQEMERGALVRLDTMASQLRKQFRGLQGEGASALGLVLVAYLRNGRGSGPGYQLAPYPLIWLDTDALVWNITQAARMERFGEDALPWWERAYALASRGAYLPDDPYSEWAIDKRAEVEGALRQCVHALHHLYLSHHGAAGAQHALLLLRSYWLTHQTDEDALRPLMELLGEMECYNEAEEDYQQFLLAFAELGPTKNGHPRKPDPRTQDIREYLRTKQIQRQRVESPTMNGAAQFATGEKQQSVSHLKYRSLDWGESAKRASSIPREESMLQLAKEQQVAERRPLVQMETGQRIVVPSGSDMLALPLPLHPIPIDMISMENALWFVLKQRQWETLVSSYSGQALSWKHLQAQLDEEFHTMKPRPLDREYTLSRRQALMTIAAGPVTLLLEFQKQTRPDLVEEELLPCCAASVAACWHLMRGSEFALVDEVLSKYLALLERIAVRASNYQAVAAGLASQGYRIKGILALHRLDAATRERSFQQAVFYSDIASDPRLQTAALISLAYHNQNPTAAEQIYRQALQHTHSLSPLLLARLYAELAVTVAKQSNRQEAFQYLSSAQEIYPDYPEQDECFLYAEFSPSSLIMENGRTWLALSEHYPDEEFALQAMTTLHRIEGLQHQSMVPQRIHVEITNYRAKTALALRERDAFCAYLEQGIRGADLLRSQKRRDEAMMLYRDASLLWPDEKPMKALKDVFLEPKIT